MLHLTASNGNGLNNGGNSLVVNGHSGSGIGSSNGFSAPLNLSAASDSNNRAGVAHNGNEGGSGSCSSSCGDSIASKVITIKINSV